MSQLDNSELIERARELAEMYTGTPLEDAFLNNIERGDLEMVAQLVRETEDLMESEAYAELRESNDVF